MKRRLRQYTVLLPAIFWSALLAMIVFIPPGNVITFFFFYLLVFFSVFYSLRILIIREWSIIWAITVLFFLVLKQFDLDSIINVVLLLLLSLTAQWYVKSQ